MNPADERHLTRLRTAVGNCYRKLEPFRINRLAAIKEFVGTHYSDTGSAEKVPMNLLELAVTIYTYALASGNPRALVTTKHKELKPGAATFELGLNHLFDEIRFRDTLQEAAHDALFGMAIVKVGLGLHSRVAVDGFTHDIGQPFADGISLSDWFHDVNAPRFEKVTFCGDRYQLPLEYVMESDTFENTGGLAASDGSTLTGSGDEKDTTVSRGNPDEDDGIYKMVDLQDVWLPLENLMVTMPVQTGKAIRIVEWEGPEHGPYHLLRFTRVPAQIMPLAPTSLWMDIHKLANRLFVKLGNQADRQKTITAYRSAGNKDAQRIVDAADGETVRTDDPKNVASITYPGIDPQTFGFVTALQGIFSWQAGNLDALGGLSAMSETVGQDEMMNANASKRMRYMQDQTVAFAKDIMRDLGAYLWTDPLIELPLVKRVSGTDIEIPVTFSPELREGDFMDYNISIEPYSLQDQTPSERLAKLTQLYMNIIIPGGEMFAQQGITPDLQGFLRLYAKYANMNELDDIVTFAEPTSTEPGVVKPPTKPAQTRREYVRTNRPGRTKRGADYALTQTAMGGGVQDSEKRAMTGV